MSRRPIAEDDLHGYVDGALEPERKEEVADYLRENGLIERFRREFGRATLASFEDC